MILGPIPIFYIQTNSDVSSISQIHDIVNLGLNSWFLKNSYI